jgi:hypothetical protein
LEGPEGVGLDLDKDEAIGTTLDELEGPEGVWVDLDELNPTDDIGGGNFLTL